MPSVRRGCEAALHPAGQGRGRQSDPEHVSSAVERLFALLNARAEIPIIKLEIERKGDPWRISAETAETSADAYDEVGFSGFGPTVAAAVVNMGRVYG